MTTASGACQCRRVRFHATLPTKWVAHCHCSMCRRAHGAAFVTWAGFEAPQVQVESDDDALRWYASSTGAARGFCAHCGSMLFFRSERWPGELHIARALFDDGLDRAPRSHVYWSAHVDWAGVDPNDGLPRER